MPQNSTIGFFLHASRLVHPMAAVVNVLGNCLVIVCAARSPKLRTSLLLLLVNLAVADLLVGVTFVALVMYRGYFQATDLLSHRRACLSLLALSVLVTMSSLSGIFLVALQRCAKITTRCFLNLNTRRNIAIGIPLAWTWAILSGVSVILGNNPEASESCTLQRYTSMSVALNAAGLSIIAAITAMYARILCYAVKARRVIANAQNLNVLDLATYDRERRIQNLVLVLLSILLVTCLPQGLLSTIPQLQGSSVHTELMMNCSLTLIQVNSFANPLIYALKIPQFRQAVRKLFRANQVGVAGGNQNAG